MANYSVAGNKIKFDDPMLVEGNVESGLQTDRSDPWEPVDDPKDPMSYYRQIQEHERDKLIGKPSGKPDLANPHPESMAGLKAANGGQIPQHLQPKKAAPEKPIFRYDAGSISNRQESPDAGAASRPELPDAGTASTTYDENDSDVMPWAGNPQTRIPSNSGAGGDSDEMTAEGDPSKRIASNMFRGPPRSAMMPGVTPVEPDTKAADLAVNPGFTPYYESETGKGVKEQGRQRLQEYLQKLAGRGKQHEERLAHDNDAAGAKARNDFGALLMDSASMVGTLGGKRADTTQLAKFPGKLYQADMAPSRSAMMYENAEDKDFKSLADIGDRQERTDIARGTMENNRERLKRSLKEKAIKKRPYSGMVDEKGKPVPATIDDEGHIERATVDSGLSPKTLPTKPLARPTESENKYATYGKSAVAELPLIEQLEKSYQPGWSYSLGEILPDVAGRHVTTENDKRYAGAMGRFLDNLVHAATGANATEKEVKDKLNGYSVRPKDPPQVIADKHRARRLYVKGIIEAAGNAGKGIALPQESGAQPMEQKPLEHMTREEKEAELERLQNG